ncbi:MAG: zinc ribbon domain-containing protein [Acidobacteria bacterium]|nr:zinc ribbon domain-containing protein [Acidobacteriota bacterium]
MFCPGCAIQITDDTKFCKNCGANLRGVREAMTTRGEQFDWSKTWVADMFMSQEERERRRGITPEHKRNNEIKGGVITTLAGLGAMIFLYYLLGAVASNEPNAGDAEIIRRVWLAGLVPFLVGIGILFNGLFLSKPRAKSQPHPQFQPPADYQLPARTTNELLESSATDFSVIEHTTAHLPEKKEAIYAQRREDQP